MKNGEQKRANEIANLAGEVPELISNILKSCKTKDKKEEPHRIQEHLLPHCKVKNDPTGVNSMGTVCPSSGSESHTL